MLSSDDLVTGEADAREQLAAWIEVMTGMELDENGVARVLEEADWTARKQQLEALGGVPAQRELE